MTDRIADVLETLLSFNPKETDPLVEDISLKTWMMHVLDLCKNANNFDDAIGKITPRKNEYSTSIGFQDELPYSSLLLAYVCYKWGRHSEAAEAAKNAIDEFKTCGKISNQAIALWIRALAFEEEKHIESAQKDIGNALFLIEKKLLDDKRNVRMSSDYKDDAQIRALLHKANDRLERKFRSNISNVRSAPSLPPAAQPPPPTPPAPVAPPPPVAAPSIDVRVPIEITLSNSMKATVSSEAVSTQSANVINSQGAFPLEGRDFPHINISSGMQTPLELEEISLPWLPLLIHPIAQANPYGQGGYIIEGDEERPTEISHIRIEGQVCEIHLVKNSAKSRDHLTRLISSRGYKWMRVCGDSMQDFEPKIEDGDYALFYNLEISSMEDVDYDLVYQNDSSSVSSQQAKLPDDNVVIVRQVDDLTNEISLLIKSYKNSEALLYSYNNEKKYKPLPLCEKCQIIGIVVAIAKPPREQGKGE